MARITLAWDCVDYGEGNTNFETGLVASRDLAHWGQVAVMPYQTSNFCTLTNRPAWEFYRAFNRWKIVDTNLPAGAQSRP